MMRWIFITFLGLIGILTVSFIQPNHLSSDGGPDKKPKDTAKAVVAYGDDYLFQSMVDFNTIDISGRIDSLFLLDSLTPEIKKEIAFYKTVANKSEEDIYLLVDSLFELDSVPFALINQINLFAAMMPTSIELPKKFDFVAEDGSPYPANLYYQKWDNRTSWNYPSTISVNDSIMVLLLADKERKYAHPLSQKTLRRYYGWVTSYYGWRDGRAHNGVDLELHYYDSVLNMFDGKVRVARSMGGFGKVVIVRHYNGLETLYAHLSKFRVKEGDTVKAGQLLGHGGQTGNATGTHLHLEVRFKGLPINPSHIISFSDKELYADTLILKKMRHSYIAYPYGSDYHIVKKGESPYRIAKRYGLPLTDFCALNNITKKTRLIVGQKLKIKVAE